jgi:CDP-diacylglycerol--serine O-phosphatidyltransferase
MRVTRSIIPNLFTLANLFCGFGSIIASTEGDFERAAVLILLSGLFDALDGAVARLVRSTSEFGVELDSLCDVVSFGVAPSVMIWSVFYHDWLNWGLLIAALPALMGVLRLARFNVQLTSMEDKAYFLGMPIPAAAFTLVSYVIFTHLKTDVPEEWKPALLTTLVVMTSLAMVSTVKYDNMPRPTPRGIKERPFVFVVFLVGLIAMVLTKGAAIFPFMVLYMVGGAIRHGIYLLRTGGRDETDDTLEEPDPDPFSM